MKNLLALLTVLCMFINFGLAQEERINITDESVQQALENLQLTESQLEEALKEIINDNYVRVPREDYDTLVNNTISEKVNNKFNTLLYIITAVLGILTTFNIFQNRSNQNKVESGLERIEKQIRSDITNETKATIDELKEEYLATIEPKLENLRLNLGNEDVKINNRIEELRNKMDKFFIDIENRHEQTIKQVSRAENYLTNREMDEIALKIQNKTFTVEDIEGAFKLLENIKKSEDYKFQVPKVINHIGTMLYRMGDKYDSRLLDLIAENEKEYKLTQTTYVNGGLISFNKYHQYATSKNHRDTALAYLDKSLLITDGYGAALALKLEIFMMDYLRAHNDEERAAAKQNAGREISDIINSSIITAYETIERLNVDFSNPSGTFQKYMDKLYELFSDEMNQMLEKANSVAVERPELRTFTLADITNLGIEPVGEA